MTATVFIFLSFLSGAFLSLLISYLFFQKKLHAKDMEYSKLQSEIKLQQERQSRSEDLFENLKTQQEKDFKLIAQSILEEKSTKINDWSQKRLEEILNPLQGRLKEFQDKVELTYQSETRERTLLKHEVQKLMELNLKMSLDAQNLTKALKGDAKIQGDWGEMVLEKVLESSGLRKGIEYKIQDSHNSEEGKSLRPDVVVYLPDDKHLIIDSKVSLKAYEAFMSSEDLKSAEAQNAIQLHLKSIKEHIDRLSAKHYAKIKGLKSPDFVFLFVPIESAYLLAMQADTQLSTWAWSKNVALVTATTLFTNLRTVASIWKIESQNQNAHEIAREGAKLYDKFVGLAGDLEEAQRLTERALESQNAAFSKLKIGPGNVFRKIEKLRELGASPNKKISPQHLENLDEKLNEPDESSEEETAR